MLLCDRVARDACEELRGGPLTTALPVNHGLARAIATCPVRYVMAPSMYAHCREAAVDQADCVLAAVGDLRFGHRACWIEWTEDAYDGSNCPARAGVFIECDENGRSGRLVSVWTGEDGRAKSAPGRFHFDFDAQIGAGLGERADRAADSWLYDIYDALFRHAAFCVEDWWMARLRAECASATDMRDMLLAFYHANIGDFPLICAFQTLLNLPRAVTTRAADRTRLNRARARKGAPPLLDHIEVSLRLCGEAQAGAAGEDGDGRRRARLHWVRGHLMRKQERVFWRRSHVRGNAALGAVAARTVTVSSIRPPTQAAE